MKRIQAFEFNDSPWCPLPIRESIVEILGNTFATGKIYQGLGEEFQRFCREAKCGAVLDVCSGSGMPATSLLDGLTEAPGRPEKMYLSDLYPNVELLQSSVQRHPDILHAINEPVDATALPDDIEYCGVSMFSALHHFNPEQVRGILEACISRGKSFFMAEAFTRDLRCFAPIFVHALLPLLRNPLTTHRARLLKFVLTYLLPLIPNALLWDGIVSVMRIHSKDELMALVSPYNGNYRFDYREIPIGLGGKVTVFSGHPLPSITDHTNT